jgi:hypothetical protein
LSKVPAVTLTFWIIKILATTLGETGGNTVSMTWNLGYLIGGAGQLRIQPATRLRSPQRAILLCILLLPQRAGDHPAQRRNVPRLVKEPQRHMSIPPE